MLLLLIILEKVKIWNGILEYNFEREKHKNTLSETSITMGLLSERSSEVILSVNVIRMSICQIYG